MQLMTIVSFLSICFDILFAIELANATMCKQVLFSVPVYIISLTCVPRARTSKSNSSINITRLTRLHSTQQNGRVENTRNYIFFFYFIFSQGHFRAFQCHPYIISLNSEIQGYRGLQQVPRGLGG